MIKFETIVRTVIIGVAVGGAHLMFGRPFEPPKPRFDPNSAVSRILQGQEAAAPSLGTTQKPEAMIGAPGARNVTAFFVKHTAKTTP